MSRSSLQMRNLAQSLIAHETIGRKISETNKLAAFQICEKLRPHLATLMGSGGFRALLGRALTLAGAEVPWLRAVLVKPDGTLEGLDELAPKVTPEAMTEGAVVLIAELLGLLEAFIGQALTLRMVRDLWPKLSLTVLNFSEGDNHEKA